MLVTKPEHSVKVAQDCVEAGRFLCVDAQQHLRPLKRV